MTHIKASDGKRRYKVPAGTLALIRSAKASRMGGNCSLQGICSELGLEGAVRRVSMSISAEWTNSRPISVQRVQGRHRQGLIFKGLTYVD